MVLFLDPGVESDLFLALGVGDQVRVFCGQGFEFVAREVRIVRAQVQFTFLGATSYGAAGIAATPAAAGAVFGQLGEMVEGIAESFEFGNDIFAEMFPTAFDQGFLLSPGGAVEE